MEKNKDWIESMAYEMAEVFQNKMEAAYREGQKERNTNIVDPVDEVKRLADKIGIHQLYAIVKDMRGKDDSYEEKLEDIKQLQDKNRYNNGLIDGLRFAIRCNGISPDVTLP